MAPTSPIARLLLVLSLSLVLTSAHQPSKVMAAGISPTLMFTLCEALDAIKEVASVVSTFPIVLGGDDLRLSSTIADLLDLLDLSSYELLWSMSAAGTEAAGGLGTGDAQADLRAWLSGALANQDTCEDPLDDTNSVFGLLVSRVLQSVTSLLADALGQVAASSARTSSHRGHGLGQGARHCYLR